MAIRTVHRRLPRGERDCLNGDLIQVNYPTSTVNYNGLTFHPTEPLMTTIHVHDHSTAEAIYPFDARGIAKRFRHAAIFGALDALKAGETMRFVNDHDPLPLLEQMRTRYGAGVDIAYRQREPAGVMIDFVKR